MVLCSYMREEYKPIIFEFDLLEERIGKVIIQESDSDVKLRVDLAEGEVHEVITANLDQWGSWISLLGKTTIAQEFNTRSFLDALIQGLSELRKLTEVTLPAERK